MLVLFAAGAWLLSAVGGATAQAHADVPKPAAGPPSGVVADLTADAPGFPSGAAVPPTAAVRTPSLTVAPARLLSAVGAPGALPVLPTARSGSGTGMDVPDELDRTASSLTGVISVVTDEVRQVLAPALAGRATAPAGSRPAGTVRPAARDAGPDRAGVASGLVSGPSQPFGTPGRSGPDRAQAAPQPGHFPVPPPSRSGRQLPTDGESGQVHASGPGALPASTPAGGRPPVRSARRPSRWGTAGRLAGEPPVSPD